MLRSFRLQPNRIAAKEKAAEAKLSAAEVAELAERRARAKVREFKERNLIEPQIIDYYSAASATTSTAAAAGAPAAAAAVESTGAAEEGEGKDSGAIEEEEERLCPEMWTFYRLLEPEPEQPVRPEPEPEPEPEPAATGDSSEDAVGGTAGAATAAAALPSVPTSAPS